jgi:hypothetical protein
MDMFICLPVIIISFYTCISKYHIVYFKYIQFFNQLGKTHRKEKISLLPLLNHKYIKINIILRP